MPITRTVREKTKKIKIQYKPIKSPYSKKIVSYLNVQNRTNKNIFVIPGFFNLKPLCLFILLSAGIADCSCHLSCVNTDWFQGASFFWSHEFWAKVFADEFFPVVDEERYYSLAYTDHSRWPQALGGHRPPRNSSRVFFYLSFKDNKLSSNFNCWQSFDLKYICLPPFQAYNNYNSCQTKMRYYSVQY